MLFGPSMKSSLTLQLQRLVQPTLVRQHQLTVQLHLPSPRASQPQPTKHQLKLLRQVVFHSQPHHSRHHVLLTLATA